MSRKVYVNEAFRPQRVSGQQRYATEISNRLPEEVVRVIPGQFWASSALRTWIWVQTILPIRTWRGVLVSLTARAPMWHPRHLVVVHDLFVIQHPEWFSKLYEIIHAPLLRIQLATAKRLVAVSDPVAAQIEAGRAPGSVVVAPNAPSEIFLEDPELQVTAEDVLTRFDLVSGGYLMVVGNMDPRKNLARLAKAYGLLSDEDRIKTPLVVVGGSADIYRESDIEWPTGTVVTGYVDDAALRTLYANSQAVVFPSLAEGFGLPIVEAIVAGAPRLLLSDIPVFRWICGDGAAYVDPTAVSDIAAALKPDRIAQIPQPEPINGRFDWRHSASEIDNASRLIAS